MRERISSSQVKGSTPARWQEANEAWQHRRPRGALVATKEHPVVAAYRHAADRALGGVIVDLQISVLTVVSQRGPVLQRVTNRPPFGTLQQDFRLDLE